MVAVWAELVDPSMPTISTDATSASEISQSYNVLIYPIYATGIERVGRSSWDLQIGLSGLTKIAEETGGECFSVSTSQLVSFKPYLERFQKLLSNQYYVVIQVVPKNKAGFQRINVQTESSNSEILAPDNMWVPAAAKSNTRGIVHAPVHLPDAVEPVDRWPPRLAIAVLEDS